MNRLLLACVLALIGAPALGAPAVAMPVNRPAHAHSRACPKKHAPKRCRRAKRHGTQSAGIPAPAPSAPIAPSPARPSPSAPVPTLSAAAAPTPSAPPAQVQLPVPLPSAWDRPALSDPTTVEVTGADHVIVLDQSRDYIVECPPGPLELSSALNVWGGRNVVFENCDVDLTNPDWAARFSDQTGTLWIHDVHFGGSQLTGGVQLQEPGATVVMRDVLFDKVYGSQSTNHAELIQTWSGPDRLLIDGLTGSTTYQGLFLLPDQFSRSPPAPPPAVFDLRNIDIDDTQGAYALWLDDVNGSPPNDASGAILTWNVENVYVVPNPARTWPGWWLWPQPSTGDPTWDGAQSGAPPGGSYVHATSAGASGVDEGSSPPALLGETP